MGRAMLLAAAYPFRAVVGVELHPTLARIARRNLAQWRAAGRTRVPYAHASAAMPRSSRFRRALRGFSLQSLWRARAAAAAASMETKLAARAGQLDILYVNNEQKSVLACEPGFERLFRGQIRRSHADAVADRTILTQQPGAEYAAPGWEDCSIYRWEGKEQE